MVELCVLVAVLTVLTLCVVGFVSIVRALGRSAPATPAEVPVFAARCRRCGRACRGGGCANCGMDADEAAAWADWQATVRHLNVYLANGLISEAVHHRLGTFAREQLRRLEGTPAPVPAPPRPEMPAFESLMEALPAEPMPDVVPTPEPVRPAELNAAGPQPKGGWLAAFMEERHILWGELVGGLLVVGCTVALVLSLWRKLQQIPLFPFLILAAIATTMFAIGRYTLRRWKLEATSRGLLVIALLLVPLNFLVLAGLAPREGGSVVEWLIKCAAVPAFVALVWRAGRDVFPEQAADCSPWASWARR